MKKRNSVGCGSILLIGIGYAVYESTKDKAIDFSSWAAGVFICVLIIVIIKQVLFGNGICEVCGQKIQRKGGVVEINGKRHRACADCVRNARAKFSRNALKKKGL